MADKRPYAKIDTGYMMNPKWFRIERELRDDDRIDERTDYRSLVRVAREAHIASILYCAQNVTDGLFPVDAIKAITVVRPEEEPAITALFTVGMWVNETGGLARVHDYLEHQTSSEKVKQLSDAGKKAVSAREAKRSSDRSSNRSSDRSSEEKRREEKRNIERATSATRPDDDPAFLAFWDNYPKKVSKDQARKAYEKRIKQGISPSVLASKALEYATLMEHEQRDKKFIKNPATWLNAAAYEDDMAIPQEKISHEQWKMNNLPKVDLNEWL